MPSKSAAQHRLMEAAAHTKGGFGGVPQSVGKDFVAHDRRVAAHHRNRPGQQAHHHASKRK